MAKTFTLGQLERKTYDLLQISEKYRPHLGTPTKDFSISITGESGNGKTSYGMDLVHDIITHGNGRLLYASSEEGDDKTFQDAARRSRLFELNPKKIKFIHQCGFDDIMEELNNAKGEKFRFLVCDSIDSLNLTYNQWVKLKDKHPQLSRITISWAKNGLPKSQYASDIFFMSHIKIIVENYVAIVRSCRFAGGGKDHTIWAEGAKKFGKKISQPSLFN